MARKALIIEREGDRYRKYETAVMRNPDGSPTGITVVQRVYSDAELQVELTRTNSPDKVVRVIYYGREFNAEEARAYLTRPAKRAAKR